MHRDEQERRGYGQYRRDENRGRGENLLERIKNDVKSWFEDDDGRDRRDDERRYGSSSGYEESRYGRRERWDDDYEESRYGRPSRYGREVGDDNERYGRSYQEDENDYGRERRSRRSSQGVPFVLYSEYWVTPGPHAGVGPKGYQRSPESLIERVCERLEGQGELDASDIEVSADSDEVTLSGTVESRYQKRLADECAEAVYGVRDVHNRLKVRRSDEERARQDHGEEHQGSNYEGRQGSIEEGRHQNV